MAYEISEGAAAAAVLLKSTELKIEKVNSIDKLITAMGVLHKNLDNVVMSDSERIQYKAWFNVDDLDKEIANKNKDAKLTAVLHGYSAARGIKAWFKASQAAGGGGEKDDNVAKNNVYVTGAGWHEDIAFLKMSVGDWDDYNSSDLVVIKNKCYYGISLKKKKKDSSADPPMINKSVKSLLEELGQAELAEEFYGARGDYFGGQILKQTKNGGALAGSKINGMEKVDLFATIIKHPIKSTTDWVNLMDIKGEGRLNLKKSVKKYEYTSTNKGNFILDDKGKEISEPDAKAFKENLHVRKLFGYDENGKLKSPGQLKMRKTMNNNLRDNSPLYKKLEGICNDKDMAGEIGKKLVNAVMKVELKKEFKNINEQKKYKDKHFGFALVTALGEVKGGKITAQAATASFKSDPTMQQVVANMFSAVEKDNFIITIDKKKTDAANDKTEPPAKLFFVIGVGTYPLKPEKTLLQLDVRYKGSFSPSPQFVGGLTKAFAKKLSSLTHREQYEFGKDCDK